MASKILWLILASMLFGSVASAQDTPTWTTNYRFKKWTEGQYPTADSISDNWDDLDSLLYYSGGVSYLQWVPFYTETATGAAWAGADNAVTAYPFTLTSAMTPDSAVIFFTANSATTDSIQFGIYSYGGASRHCLSAWVSPAAASSNQRVAAVFSTTTRIPAGTYLMAYAVANMVASTPIPTAYVISSQAFLAGAQSPGGTRRIGSITSGLSGGNLPSTLSGLTTLSPTNVPMMMLVGE